MTSVQQGIKQDQIGKDNAKRCTSHHVVAKNSFAAIMKFKNDGLSAVADRLTSESTSVRTSGRTKNTAGCSGIVVLSIK